jgi:restriction endonuclease S subunit
MVKLGEVCEQLLAGGDAPTEYSQIITDKFNIPIFSNGIKDKGLYGYTSKAKIFDVAITISARGTIGYSEIRYTPFVPIVRLIVAIPNIKLIDIEYLKFILDTLNIYNNGNSIPQLTIPMIKNETIPLPPLEIQQRLVAEAEEIENVIKINKQLIQKMEGKIKEVMEGVNN